MKKLILFIVWVLLLCNLVICMEKITEQNEITNKIIEPQYKQQEDIIIIETPDNTSIDISSVNIKNIKGKVLSCNSSIENTIEVGEEICISADMDLKTRINISAEDINRFLNKYTSSESLLHDKGDAFATASDVSGYNPLFLVAVAANESGWEVSPIHAEKNNPYSISMYDWDIEAGYKWESFSEGIINGAKWISDNYYENGQTTINLMQYGIEDHIYASDPNWADNITCIMQVMYSEIFEEECQ